MPLTFPLPWQFPESAFTLFTHQALLHLHRSTLLPHTLNSIIGLCYCWPPGALWLPATHLVSPMSQPPRTFPCSRRSKSSATSSPSLLFVTFNNLRPPFCYPPANHQPSSDRHRSLADHQSSGSRAISCSKRQLIFRYFVLLFSVQFSSLT